jgi:hypothetical protein
MGEEESVWIIGWEAREKETIRKTKKWVVNYFSLNTAPARYPLLS